MAVGSIADIEGFYCILVLVLKLMYENGG